MSGSFSRTPISATPRRRSDVVAVLGFVIGRREEIPLLTSFLGACERSVACSTCHVILEPEIYDMLPEPDDEENDMLDLAFGLEDT